MRCRMPLGSTDVKEGLRGESMAAQVDRDKCTGCELCVNTCPVEAITLKNDKAKVNAEICVDCGQCVEVCPNEAISIT